MQKLRDFTLDAGRKRDHPLAIAGEEFLIDARLVVKTLQLRETGELEQILVACLVLCQENDVVRLAIVAVAAGA